MKIIKEKETFSYTSDKNIIVFVRINYSANTFAIVKPSDKESYKINNLSFNNRGVEYMQGWQDILEAHIEAIREAKRMYEEWDSNRTDEKVGEMIRLRQEF
jgi:hypothetical protein